MQLGSLMGKVSLPKRIECPAIEPLPEGIHRPFWSVMIPTYNRASYLEKTLKGVLEQDPGPDEMQIEVIDNCSTADDPEAVIRKTGGRRITFYRQSKNVGMSANWTTCINRARGYWVHILHDDDMLMPGFYAAYKHFIGGHPQVVLVFSRAISIDENDRWLSIMHSAPNWTPSGIVENAAYELVKKNFISAPTAILSRETCVKAGGFASCLSYCADWEMWMRIAASGPIGYIHQPYLLYRVHSKSDTNRLAVSAKSIEEIVRTIEIGVRRLQPELQKNIRAEAYKHYSGYANAFRTTLHASREHRDALWHAFMAFRLYPSTRNFLCLIESVFKLWLANNRR